MFRSAMTKNNRKRPSRPRSRNRRDLQLGVIKQLPSDIVCYQILPRLPVKSLMQFKCVCKSWFSLIRSHSFVKAHLNFCYSNKKKNTTNLLFLYWPSSFLVSKINGGGNKRRLTNLPYIKEDIHTYYAVVQSINGLVCASGGYDTHVKIFNPSTRESIKLPTDSAKASKYQFRPTYHFGFSPLVNEYKVLQVAYNDGALMMDIFTLGSDSSWRPLIQQGLRGDLPFGHPDFGYRWNGVPLLRSNCRFERSVCLHGAIHWMDETENILVVLDVGDEKFRSAIPLPDHHRHIYMHSGDDYLTIEGIVEVGGCLAVYGVGGCTDVLGNKLSMDEHKRTLVLWILKDYHNHVWVKETILVWKMVTYIHVGWYVYPLCTIHTGELAIVVQPPCTSPGYDDGPPTLYLYDMKTKEYHRNHDFNYHKHCVISNLRLVTSYENTIVPLK